MSEQKEKLLLKTCDILKAEGESDFALIKDGYLGIEGDTIAYIGKKKPEGYDKEKDMHGRMLIPGLINCHGHAAMVLVRGFGSGLPLDRWLHEAIFPIEDKMSEADIEVGNAWAQMEMLKSGTTAYSDMYDKPLTAIRLCEKSGMKANLTRPVLCFDENERAEDSWRVKGTLELFERYHKACNGRIRVDYALHAEYTNKERLTREYCELCARDGARMQVHISETRKEHEECKAHYGKTPTQWFYDLGMFNSPVAAAHCVFVEDGDMRIFKEHGASVIHNPSSNMKLGSGFAPIKKMLDMGINVALGTDGAASNDNLNMFEEMHLAALIHNGISEDPTAMQPKTVFNMATRNGARLQGREDTGELRVGKKADIVAIDMEQTHLRPSFDPLSTLIYTAQGSDVCMTMVDGRILYENGEFFTIDAEKTRYEFDAAVQGLLSR